jgi:transcriptional regulator with XRE-family HTH domain
VAVLLETPEHGASLGGIRGELLRWARTEQSLTMREVQRRGGPSPGYQSEVENGTKTEVRSSLLAAWVRALSVTEAFARGELPVYRHNPAQCIGLAAHAAFLISAKGHPDWPSLSPSARVHRVLVLITQEPQTLPRIVLAHVLGLPVSSLERMIRGELSLLKEQMQALAVLTALPERFFKSGTLEPDQGELDDQEYLPVLRDARLAGITPEQLREWIRRHST